jgi:hypothetical protein
MVRHPHYYHSHFHVPSYGYNFDRRPLGRRGKTGVFSLPKQVWDFQDDVVFGPDSFQGLGVMHPFNFQELEDQETILLCGHNSNMHLIM